MPTDDTERTRVRAPHPSDRSSSIAIGMMLGPYRIERALGQGGMGSIWLAEHTGLSKRVAVKTLAPEYAQDREMVERFLREGRAASALRHPNVVNITDVDESNGVPFLVMEYLEGESLATRLERGRMSLRDAANAFVPIIAALHEAHRAGVVHRDLKPDNIFIAADVGSHERPVLLDFGIAKMRVDNDRNVTKTASFLGTPHYVPPEQASNAKGVDAKSDQYALGVTLYEALAGKRPFEGDTFIAVIGAIVLGEYTPLSELRPDLPHELVDAIRVAMDKDPAKRWPSVRDLGVVLLPHASTRVRHSFGEVFGLGEVTRMVQLGDKQLSGTAALDDTVRDSLGAPIAPEPKRNVPLLASIAGLLVVATIVLLSYAKEPSSAPGPETASPDAQRGPSVPPLVVEPPDATTRPAEPQPAAVEPPSPAPEPIADAPDAAILVPAERRVKAARSNRQPQAQPQPADQSLGIIVR